MGYSRKKTQEMRVEYILFEDSLEFLGFLLYPWKFSKQNKVSPLETPQNRVTPLWNVC